MIVWILGNGKVPDRLVFGFKQYLICYEKAVGNPAFIEMIEHSEINTDNFMVKIDLGNRDICSVDSKV